MPARTEVPTRVTDAEIAALRATRFSVTKRGYDPEAVDRYAARVNRIIAELQMTASPKAAMKHALEDVERERLGVIEEAQRAAEEITSRSRTRADDRIQEATKEAQKLREAAERDARQLRDAAAQEARGTRVAAEATIGALEADVEALIEKRDRAIEELVELSRSLDELRERNGAVTQGQVLQQRIAG